MTLTTRKLTLTASSHLSLVDYLFPGDGLEAVAILICNLGKGRLGEHLIVKDIVFPPYERCERYPDKVIWPFAEIVPPSLISTIDREGQSLITIHSHPSGDAFFSAIDDENDYQLITSIAGWFDDARPHGTAVMRSDGMMIARVLDESGEFRNIEVVGVVGEEIQFWKRFVESPERTSELRIKQTFGQGTLEMLKGMLVGVVGCSGTGSIMIELLVRNAIGALVIVDDDSLDELNLNRIINGTSEDARLGRPKVRALEEAIERIGLGTNVCAFEGRTDSASVVRALIDCDVIFGCMDTAFGRYHLDCIASAYLIPYFDLGVDLVADGEGGIQSADAVSHYVHPDGTSLLSRMAYTMDQVTSEMWHRDDVEHHERQWRAGYLAAVDENHPAVISVNMQAACLAFNDFLARISNFRLDSNGEFTTQRFRLVHGSFENDTAKGEPHDLLKPYVASGDKSLLVRNNTSYA